MIYLLGKKSSGSRIKNQPVDNFGQFSVPELNNPQVFIGVVA
ncbi:hypothetical protein CORMATOL_01421 [Corynebacterium matruchotii ATCC 33806]|uniref:Uncharacterized protein n=1 Tax=Corynebacterium matruchotii ATCC 33806 TaxID=566549 RepID=C0E359_9CORY|nr:hypothetical protein CORMATOL_01421 [Corynebacterium matruchotii ATCC 33806]